MVKYQNKEAYFSRINDLAQVGKVSIKEERNVGTLIDIQRDMNGIAYGIIKENHNYYIKKGNTASNLDASDFSYIGGLENIKLHQYHSVSEAEKQRNFLIKSINESQSLVVNKSGTKLVLDEGFVAKGEIENSESKLGDLDAATAEEKVEVPEAPVSDPNFGVEPEAEMPDAEAPSDIPMDGEAPVDDTATNDVDDMGGEAPIDAEPSVEASSEENREIQKMVGKVTELIRKTEMTDPEVKYNINSFLSSFKEKLPEIDIEERKDMANKILKTVDPKEIDDLEQSMPPDEVDEETCTECGGFAQYAESRGYTKDSIQECDINELASLVSGYANAYNEGKNNGDAKAVALYSNDELAEALAEEYGHEDYVSEILKPEMMKLSEATEEDKQIQMDELWSSALKTGGKFLGKGLGAVAGGIKNAANSAGRGIANAASGVANAAGSAYNTAAGAVKQVGADMKADYQNNNKNASVQQVNKIAQELKVKIDAMNAAIAKTGGATLDVNTVLEILKKQLAGAPSGLNAGAKAAWGQGKNNSVAANVKEGNVDAGYTEADDVASKEMLAEVDETDEIDNETDNGEESYDDSIDAVVPETEPQGIGFAPDAQVLGIGGTGEDKGLNVNVDGNNKTINISMNEGKYPDGHALATSSTIKNVPEKISTPTTNLKGVDKIAKKTQGHVMTTSATIKSEPEKTSTPTTNLKGVEVTPKKTQGHVPTKNSTIATKPVKTEMIKEEELEEGKPSAGLSKKEKSDVVKDAKAGKDIGKKGKGFEKVADKAAKEYGSKEAGKKVAAAAMWKNKAKANEEVVSEGELKIRKYVRQKLQELAGIRKPRLNEGVKSEKLKKLDEIIENQYKLLNNK